MYKIRKSEDFRGKLKLLTSNGAKKLDISLTITPDLLTKARKLQVDILDLQKKAQKGNLEQAEIEKLGRAIVDTFRLLLGDENTETLMEIYNQNPAGMFKDIYPYIQDVIQAARTKAAKTRSNFFKRKAW